MKYVTRDFHEKTRKSQLKNGDILVVRVGHNRGDCCVVKGVSGDLNCANIVFARPYGKLSGFLGYYFQSPEGQQALTSISSGSAQEVLNTRSIASLQVPQPSEQEAESIAGFLGALDDEIELNRRMNETLEAIAHAIFKSWFVHYDPLRAKMAGRQAWPTGINHAALYPNRFVDSRAGEIPLGWDIRPIGDVTEVVGGSTPRTEEAAYWANGSIAWATPKDLASLDSPILLDTERHITEEGLKQISSGLLPSGTVLLSSRAPIGYLAISEIPLAVNQGFIALVCKRDLSNYFVLNWIRENLATIKAHANGSTFLEISKANFRPLEVVVPPRDLRLAFDRTAAPLYERITTNLHESKTLAETRDALLPKLISGEIRIQSAQDAAGGAD